MYIRETIAIVNRLPISNEDRERIFWRNAVDLLDLPGARPRGAP
jgi:predicted TIM-barrel fold metal-dependent hydrolase